MNKPTAMSVPLSDTHLAAIRERVPSAVCSAAHPDEADKGHVWVIGSLSGSLRCSACHLSQRALDSDEVVLLAEVDRLRAENEQLAEDAARDVARERERAGRCERDMVEARAEAKRLRAELATAQASIRAVETVKCWTNEDGRRFVFAEDLAFALGYTPTTAKES